VLQTDSQTKQQYYFQLQTEHFIMALKKFITQQGRPQIVYSDNGTTFMGANNELQRCIKQQGNRVEIPATKCSTFWRCKAEASAGVRARLVQGHVRTTRNFVCFAKKSVNAKPFLVRTIFVTHQNFRKCHQTSNMPSTSFGGLQFFVRRENLLFFYRYPSTGHHIS